MLSERSSGNDKEALFVQTGDGEVALDPTALVEGLGVDDSPHRLVDVIRANVVQELQCAGAAHFEFVERCFVEQTSIFASLDMLVPDGA